MKEILAQLGMDTAATAANFGLEQLGNALNMKRQHKYQKKINRFNNELAYELWERTGPKGMMEQLKQSGLNPGLMYGMSGAGAGTTQGSSGSGTGSQSANAQVQLGMGLQLQQQKAMIENTKADTELKQVEAKYKAGVDTDEARSRIAAMAAETKNKEVQNELMQLDKIMKKIQNNIANETQETIIKSASEAFEKLKAETAQAVTDKRIKEESADDIIKQAKLQTEVQLVQIEAQKQGIVLSKEQTKAITAGIERTFEEIENMIYYRNIDWQNLQLDERKTIVSEAMQKVSEKMADFNTNTASQVKQWTDIVTGVADAASKWTPGGKAQSVLKDIKK